MPSLLLPFWPRTSPKVKGPAGLSAGIESARHRPDPVDGGVSQDEEAAAHRMVASLRLVLALAALIVLRIDPPEPARNVPLTYFSLTLYVVYAAIVCLQASRYGPIRAVRLSTPWPDSRAGSKKQPGSRCLSMSDTPWR